MRLEIGTFPVGEARFGRETRYRDGVLEVDRAALLQVVRILIENAIRHTPGDSQIRVAVRESGSHAELRVTDDGPGIPAEEHERIFERFARVDKARARELGGSGLGLSIARAIVSRHGGTISVTSVPPEGAAFSVRLPLA